MLVSKDPCGCDCLYEAQWACAAGEVICQAKDTKSLKHRKVADLVRIALERRAKLEQV